MDRLLLLLFVALFQPCAASNNTTSDSTSRVSWVFEPDCGRGTVDLLYACLFTIFISTWTAQHLDIGPTFLRKFAFMCFGLVAPEAVAMIAINDYFKARILMKKIKDLGLQVSSNFVLNCSHQSTS
jgi:hypothetical protein